MNEESAALPRCRSLLTPEVLGELIAGEMSDAAAYRLLSRQLPGRAGAVLRSIAREETNHAACLKGIYTLITGRRPDIQVPPPEPKRPEIALRQCYGREMRCLAAYEAQSGNPEYGPAFTRMARQEQCHCAAVLELLGELSGAKEPVI